MPATQQGKIHLSLVDDQGVRATLELFTLVDPTKTIANFIADVNAIGALILPLVDGGWVRWEASVLPALPTGASATPTPDADAEEIGGFTFPQATLPWLYTIALPTLADAVVSGSKINQADSSVTAFQTGIAGPFANGTEVLSRNWEVLGAIRQTFLGVRKHRRSLHSKSLDVINA